MKLARTLVQALLLAFLLGLMTSMARAEEPALLTVSAPNKGMDEAIHDLLQSIDAHNYSFVRQQAIDNRLVPQAW